MLNKELKNALLFSVLSTLLLAAGSAAQEPTEAEEAVDPGVTIESILVEPEKPAADTLCRLKIELKNHGEQIASQFGFTVTINGEEIPVYKNHLWMFPLQSQAVSEMDLYNFWSTETSRPMPKNGKLEIEVTLHEAHWYTIETIEGEETWTPLEAVPGLPSTASSSIEMTR